jgi:hypothetical protein
MSAHTPGPWKINGYAGEHEERGAYIVSENGRVVCATRGALSMRPEDHWEDEANARLIISAPDLLKACKTVAAFLDRLDEGLPADDPLRKLRRAVHKPLWDVLNPAIAKAEGRS